MKKMWNQRYQQEEYVYGKAPNVYFKEIIDQLPKGKILLPAEGEGRQAVYAASLGWEVYAFDQSQEGKKKALSLAKENEVEINYTIEDIQSIQYDLNSFDLIGLFYCHFPEEIRKIFYPSLVQYLKPNGHIILEGFSKENLDLIDKNVPGNGPKDPQMLFSKESIESDFSALNTLQLDRKTVFLDEGSGHQGKASVIRYWGQKR